MTIYKFIHKSKKTNKKYYIKIEMRKKSYWIYLYKSKFDAWLDNYFEDSKYPANDLPFPTESEGISYAKNLVKEYENDRNIIKHWKVI
ncbi:MAG: hypothetical protein K0Q49_2473 [Haloplasmataceae bacterium]|jgi:hypothetical protein|nr:hypothetical protein [Haloplasmataceae bacterium]